MISIIVPTYNEVENIEPLIQALSGVLDRNNIENEIIIIDGQKQINVFSVLRLLSSMTGEESHSTSSNLPAKR